ncbi:hypothetical protein PILCRDRAFT_816836 [Piloderma croceum F 1598]|uniref:Uncharacterized protein n=1 Tax=Piloderma croceum (strain F 1598) TaxID=765440 RepID=A0A0C3G4U7_PILCF|nr:hypothetical protein PILCRDRAFT_816836 [Piloderma croceum F 1598]
MIDIPSQSKEAPNDDWRRFDFYARRVRICTLTGLSRWHHTVSTYRPGHGIFPLLHMLDISGEYPFSLSMRFPRFLRTLHVHFRSTEKTSFNGGLYILSAISQTTSLENLLLCDSVHPMILVYVASFKSSLFGLAICHFFTHVTHHHSRWFSRHNWNVIVAKTHPPAFIGSEQHSRWSSFS